MDATNSSDSTVVSTNSSGDGLQPLSVNDFVGDSGDTTRPVLLNAEPVSVYTDEAKILSVKVDSTAYSGPLRYIWRWSSAKRVDTTDVPFNGYYFSEEDRGRFSISVTALSASNVESVQINISVKVSGFIPMGPRVDYTPEPDDIIGGSVSRTYLLKNPLHKEGVVAYAVSILAMNIGNNLPVVQQIVTTDSFVVNRALVPYGGEYLILVSGIYDSGSVTETRMYCIRIAEVEPADSQLSRHVSVVMGAHGTFRSFEESSIMMDYTQLYQHKTLDEEDDSVYVGLTGNDGYMFDSLSLEVGDAQIKGNMLYDIKSDVIVKAHFTTAVYSVTYGDTLGGAVTGPSSYTHGTSFVVTNTPDIGFDFMSYIIIGRGEADGDTIVDAQYDLTVRAYFLAYKYDITYVPSENGSFTSPESIRWGHTNKPWAKPDSSYQLDSLVIVEGIGTVLGKDTLTDVQSNITVQGYFGPKEYNVTYITNSKTRGTVTGPSTVFAGDTLALAIKTESGYINKYCMINDGPATITENIVTDFQSDFKVICNFSFQD